MYEDRSAPGEPLARVLDTRAACPGDGFAAVWRDADELGGLGEALLTQRRPIALARDGPDFPLAEARLRRLQCAESAHLLLVPLSAATGNLGLLVLHHSMQERAANIDDRLTLSSRAGQGTLIEIGVPLPRTGDEPRV